MGLSSTGAASSFQVPFARKRPPAARRHCAAGGLCLAAGGGVLHRIQCLKVPTVTPLQRPFCPARDALMLPPSGSRASSGYLVSVLECARSSLLSPGMQTTFHLKLAELDVIRGGTPVNERQQ